MPTVVLVDDHLAVLQMMRGAVEALPGFVVAGEAVAAKQGLEVCRRTRPDIVILDLALGKESGLDLIPELRATWPATRVIVFSGVLRGPAIKRALAAGAHGLIEKTAPLDELHAAMKSVAAGQVYFSRFASEQVRRIVYRRAVGRSVVIRLSERDKQILRAVAEGLSTKEASNRLGLSRHTVANRRARLMKRAGLHGTAELARYAVSLGLVSEEVEGAAEAI